MTEDRSRGTEVDAVTDVLARDVDRRQDVVQLGLGDAQLGGDAEAVHHRRLATGAVEREAVQQLEPGRVVAVGAVGVRQQLDVRVGGVRLGEVGLEVPHPAEDGLAHVADPTDQPLGRCHGRAASR